MLRAEKSAIAILRNPIAVVASALLPATVIRMPVPCAMILPGALLNTTLVL